MADVRPSEGQRSKGERFRQLHASGRCFVIANPWDGGSAKLLAHLGFEALATTSAGLAFSLGRRDGKGDVSIRETLDNARQIVEATDLPVSGDLENGASPEPEAVAKVIRAAAEVGLVGASIEDSTGDPEAPIYDFELAVERIRAAVEAARALDFPFVVTARAENFLHARPNLEDTIRRLRAFQEAGADVLYAPGLRDHQQIRSVVRAVDRPLNVVLGLGSLETDVPRLAELGVGRISLGSSLARAALGELVRAAEEVKGRGTSTFTERALPYGELDRLFGGGSQEP